MTITKEELGRRLREARTACGMTQDEAAKVLELSRPIVTLIEQGRRTVSGMDLDRLARAFGRSPAEFFDEGFAGHEDALQILFRAEPAIAQDPAVQEQIRHHAGLGRLLGDLEALIGVAREGGAVPTYPMPAPTRTWDAVKQGHRAAREERRRLGLGDGPVGDLARVLEDEGVRTAAVSLPDDLSGLTMLGRDGSPLVIVNAQHRDERQRFSLAHEYAHVVLDRDRRAIVSRVAPGQKDLVETRANAFAAEFLTPETGLRDFLGRLGKGGSSRVTVDAFDGDAAATAEARTEGGTGQFGLHDVIMVALHFDVSITAALYRMKSCALVTEDEFRLLHAAVKRDACNPILEAMGLPLRCSGTGPAKRQDRPGPEGDGLRIRFVVMAIEALRRGQIDGTRFLTLLSELGVAADVAEVLLQKADDELPPGDLLA